MANLAVKVADLDAACAFYEAAGAEVRDRMHWGNGERADVFLGPVMITLFTRAIYEDEVELPAEGFLHPALFTDDLDAELEGHTVVWGPAVVEGAFGTRRIAFVDAPGGIRLEFMEQLEPAGGSMSFTPYDRPVRAAFVGLGRIYDLNVRAYVDNPDVEVVALVDPSEERRAQRQADWPDAPHVRVRGRARGERPRGRRGRGAAADPAARRRRHRAARLRLARQPAEADVQRPRRARSGCSTPPRRNDRVLRVMENYLFYEPLRKLKETVESGELGDGQRLPHEDGRQRPRRLGRAGEQLRVAVPADAARPRHPRVRRRLAQARDRALALRPDHGGARLGRATPRSCPGIEIDAPTTIVWEHENGIRGVWDITLAIDMYLRSDYYTNDERWEVTGRRGYARVNRCTGRGIQQPSLEVYADGEMRALPRARRRLGQQLPRLRTPLAALAPHRRRPAAAGARDEAVDVLRFALAAYASSAAGGTGVDPSGLS